MSDPEFLSDTERVLAQLNREAEEMIAAYKAKEAAHRAERVAELAGEREVVREDQRLSLPQPFACGWRAL